MSDQAHVSPQALQAIISRLEAFERDLDSMVRSNRSYVESLRAQWNDKQYEAFMATHTQFYGSIQAPLRRDLPPVIAYLKALKQASEQYLRIKQRR